MQIEARCLILKGLLAKIGINSVATVANLVAITSFTSYPYHKPVGLHFNGTQYTMASTLFQDLVAPNGHKYTQPLGLFINNEWRAAKSGEKIMVISPMYGYQPHQA